MADSTASSNTVKFSQQICTVSPRAITASDIVKLA